MLPWWVARLVLVAGWIVAVFVAIARDMPTCTPQDPSVCGPDVRFAWAAVALLATPVLLWWLPLAGCAAGVLFAVLDLRYDDVPAARVAFGVHGLLCLTAAGWLILARRRQVAVVAEVAGVVRLNAALAERLQDGLSGWGPRTLVAVLSIFAGIGCVGWYDHQADKAAKHMSAAVRVNALVLAADSDHSVIEVAVPPSAASTRIDVLEPAPYHAGQLVPVLVDRAGTEPWVRLVAEPDDVTGWLAAGLGAFALAGVLLVREQRMRSARRRLLGGPLPAVELTTEPDDEGRATLQAGTGADRLLLGVVPVVTTPTELTAIKTVEYDERWTPGPTGDFAQDWRSASTSGPDGPRAVTVAGDLRHGGWVLLITDDVVMVPEAPVRTPQRLPWQSAPRPAVPEPLPGQPTATRDSDAAPGPDILPQLPVVLRPRLRERALGALSLLGCAAGPGVVLAGLTDSWWDTIVLLCGAGMLCHDGWGRLSARATLTRGAAVVRDRLRVHHVPWQCLHGVRHDETRLWLAWDPDVVVKVSPFTSTRVSGAASAEYWAAAMMRLRDLSLAAGDPGGSVTSRANGGVAVVVIYVLVALASVWWQHR